MSRRCDSLSRLQTVDSGARIAHRAAAPVLHPIAGSPTSFFDGSASCSLPRRLLWPRHSRGTLHDGDDNHDREQLSCNDRVNAALRANAGVPNEAWEGSMIRIAIADDEPLERELLSRALRRLELEIHEAASGAEL